MPEERPEGRARAQAARPGLSGLVGAGLVLGDDVDARHRHRIAFRVDAPGRRRNRLIERRAFPFVRHFGLGWQRERELAQRRARLDPLQRPGIARRRRRHRIDGTRRRRCFRLSRLLRRWCSRGFAGLLPTPFLDGGRGLLICLGNGFAGFCTTIARRRVAQRIERRNVFR